MQQFIHAPEQAQLPLFEAFLAQPVLPGLKVSEVARKSNQPELFSELSLRGAPGHCQSLLAPVLRELSEEDETRWLTLIAPPSSLTQPGCAMPGSTVNASCCCNLAAIKARFNWPAKPCAWASATPWSAGWATSTPLHASNCCALPVPETHKA